MPCVANLAKVISRSWEDTSALAWFNSNTKFLLRAGLEANPSAKCLTRRDGAAC